MVLYYDTIVKWSVAGLMKAHLVFQGICWTVKCDVRWEWGNKL